ncbi:glycoprotease pgp1 [Ceratocystis lukuohia]|uniref:Glycoprotease pgp1 n=1 Tax=Ceratocystis lukuohia TaxID=2019550 RepID=A0ABR4MEV1_9PEZI
MTLPLRVSRNVRTPPLLFTNTILRHRFFTTLAIESSCDDTCVAILKTNDNLSSNSTTPNQASARLVFHGKTTSDNRAFQGVNPPLALEGHDRAIGSLLQRALKVLAKDDEEALSRQGAHRLVDGRSVLSKPDLIAVTRGPGMSANLAVGLNVAKGLSVAWDVPLVGVNHMQAHALTPRLVSALSIDHGGAAINSTASITSSEPTEPSPQFPFLTLLVSGGHTQLVHSSSITTHRIIANADNIALGDALDKCARHILPPAVLADCPDVMYGRALEAFAFPQENKTSANTQVRPSTNTYSHAYKPPRKRVDEVTPRPHELGWTLRPFLAQSRRMAYNFSDAESQIIHLLRARGSTDLSSDDARRALAIDTMRLLFEHLIGRVVLALEADPQLAAQVSTLVISGGVASNKFLLHIAREMLAARGFPGLELVVPPIWLCTDNAAMIAWTGLEMFCAGYQSDLSILPLKKWAVDPDIDGGILGRDGWIAKGAQ